MITVNVGKRVYGRDKAIVQRLATSAIIEALEMKDFTVVKNRVVKREPDDEDTVVAVVLDDRMDGTARQRLYQVATMLQQDCIAFAVNFGEPDHFAGALVGPRSFKWGPFNPALFHTWEDLRSVEVVGVAFKEAA